MSYELCLRHPWLRPTFNLGTDKASVNNRKRSKCPGQDPGTTTIHTLATQDVKRTSLWKRCHRTQVWHKIPDLRPPTPRSEALCFVPSLFASTNLKISVCLSPLYASMDSRHHSYENLLIDEKAGQTKTRENVYMDSQPRRQWACRHRRAIVLHLILITFYTAVSGVIIWLLGAQNNWRHRPSLIYSLPS